VNTGVKVEGKVETKSEGGGKEQFNP